jgi:hypothetical protein
MSLSLETPTSTPTSPAPETAGQHFMEYAIQSADHHLHPSANISTNPFFRTSLHLAHAWREARDADEADDISDYAFETIDQLPHNTTGQIFYRNVLRDAVKLVRDRQQALHPDLKQSVYTHSVERALDLRDILAGRRDAEDITRFQRILSNACLTTLLNRCGFAMPAMPHQLLDNRAFTHSGVLLKRGERPLQGIQRYDAKHPCGGFADGHEGDPVAYRANHSRGVKLLSACCDLRIPTLERLHDMDDILDLLESDMDNNATETERRQLDKLSTHLIQKIIWNRERTGTYQPRSKRK